MRNFYLFGNVGFFLLREGGRGERRKKEKEGEGCVCGEGEKGGVWVAGWAEIETTNLESVVKRDSFFLGGGHRKKDMSV